MNDKLQWEGGVVRNGIGEDAPDVGGERIDITAKVPGLPLIASVWVDVYPGRRSDRVERARKASFMIEAAPSMLEYLKRLAASGDAEARGLVRLAEKGR